MSIKVSVYVPSLSEELLPLISGRFHDLGMDCQFHPEFSLDPSKEAGMLSVRLRVNAPDSSPYSDTDMLSSFEISFKQFHYKSPVALSPAVNEKLKTCTMQVIVRMHATPTSAFRTGLYFAAFLAELTDGIVYTPRFDKYLEPQEALEQFTHEIAVYEAELPAEDWTIFPFVGWTPLKP